MLAQVLHRLSGRKHRPLVKVDCACLPSGLIESELFGHEKGAFTSAAGPRLGRFELAHGGTVFLDEVGELPLDQQAKLLRVLQDGQLERLGSSRTTAVDVRVIAATNRDLAEAVRRGAFRADLYYRLDVFPIHIPPLRERPGDIPPLVRLFVRTMSRRLGKAIDVVPPEVMDALLAYPWPGNTRELQNVIERAVILAPGPALLLPAGFDGAATAACAPRAHRPVAWPDPTAVTLQESQRWHISRVLEASNGRIEGPHGAARLLGLKPSTLRSRLRKLGLRR